MNVDLKYLGRSEVVAGAVKFAPNLARPKVFYDAALRDPVRFREAISALHDVVVGDLRFHRKDKTAYKAWKEEQEKFEAEARRVAYDKARQAELAKVAKGPVPPNLAKDFQHWHQIYWRVRVQWARELQRNDPELFRHLVPCDPVVTVAPDVVFFECFAKDESSYGCLLVDRSAFEGEAASGLGTTNVDYSIALYEHFQTLRTYRSTRLLVDPTGFEVKVENSADYREEKIELPPSWLRGFGQISAAVGLPSRTVELPVESVYSLLAYMKRHREKSGPRSLRFKLTPGRPPALFLDPWNVEIPCFGEPYEGTEPEEIKVWGRRRLMVLARLLPLAERFEVSLLGSGLPSVWTAHMGEMRMVLALSGWTTNDWTSGAALDLMTGGFRTEQGTLDAVSSHLSLHKLATFAELGRVAGDPSRDVLLGCLNLLAKQGQVIFDHASRVFRYRPVLPVALSDALIGPEHPELVAGRELWRSGGVKNFRETSEPGGKRKLVANVGGKNVVEAVLDADGVFKSAKCDCSWFYKNRLRGGPCRHLLALRLAGQARIPGATGGSGGTSGGALPGGAVPKWYEKFFA